MKRPSPHPRPLQGRAVQGHRGWYNRFGERFMVDPRHVAPKDIEFAERFWANNKPKGLRESMEDNIRTAAKTGTFGMFASSKGITDFDREKFSAYRVLAAEIGFYIGEYKFNPRAYTAIAQIRPLQKL